MGKIIKVFIGLIALMIVGILALTLLPSMEGAVGDAANSAKNAALNVALDASGAKNRVQQALESHVDDIAAATGLSSSAVEQGIDQLAVNDWEVATLPDSAQETGTFNGSAAGIDGTVTTYDDPSYVTVEAYGQNVTLRVPESAQSYLGYLSYLS